MADLFKARAGTVIRSEVESPAFISVGGLDGMLRGGKMLLTSLRIDRGQGIQVLKTLGNLYYIYAFGEEPGKVMVGGLMFFNDCSSNSANGEVIRQINSYYDSNNAYNRGGPVPIAAGGASFSCILTNMSIAADMTPYNYASFSLNFMLLPKNRGGGGSGAGKGLQTGSLQPSSGLQGASLQAA